jgi:cytochrome c
MLMIRTAALVFALSLLAAACGPAPRKEAAAPAAPATPEASGPALASPAPTPEAIAAKIATLPAPYNAGSYDVGKKLFANCRSCHSIDKGGRNGVGPNLHGLFGRKAGTVEGFAYSDAVKNSSIIWDGPQLENWLANPQTFLKGNRMSFAGLRKPEDRRDLIAYLKVETSE